MAHRAPLKLLDHGMKTEKKDFLLGFYRDHYWNLYWDFLGFFGISRDFFEFYWDFIGILKLSNEFFLSQLEKTTTLEFLQIFHLERGFSVRSQCL